MDPQQQIVNNDPPQNFDKIKNYLCDPQQQCANKLIFNNNS